MYIETDKKILEHFNVMLAEKSETPNLDLLASHGLVLGFNPTGSQIATLKEVFPAINIRTLFSKEEADNASPEEKIVKQVLHYIEVYGLGMPGLFDLEQDGGKLLSIRFVDAIDSLTLDKKLLDILYSNRPVSDALGIALICRNTFLRFDINKVKNNELKVMLFKQGTHVFDNGDDAVRWMCFNATSNPLLIKSKEVINAISESYLSDSFFRDHEIPLAKVFNRHKRLIVAAKNSSTSTAINRISRLSKRLHKPLPEKSSNSFVSRYLQGKADVSELESFSLRDKLKILNYIDYKHNGNSTDAFKIRNGKTFVKYNRKALSKKGLERLKKLVLGSIASNLQHLKGKKILLDENVDYGLPISRKRKIGRLPYGTVIYANDGDSISSGVYWKNEWGATDLDLSAIDDHGNRVGWGSYDAYDNDSTGMTFSGDVTYAPKGAMEFFTSSYEKYGLLLNIYDGEVGSEYELVVGNSTSKSWIDKAIIREKSKLETRNCMLGFVHGKAFTISPHALGNRRVSGSNLDSVLIRNSFISPYTLSLLLISVGIEYDVERDSHLEYDYDLTYEKFSYEKLEELLDI